MSLRVTVRSEAISSLLRRLLRANALAMTYHRGCFDDSVKLPSCQSRLVFADASAQQKSLIFLIRPPRRKSGAFIQSYQNNSQKSLSPESTFRMEPQECTTKCSKSKKWNA